MKRKKVVLAYVLYVERGDQDERVCWVYPTLAATEEGLRHYSQTIWIGGRHDEEIVTDLADECNGVARIFECSNLGSIELVPFARASEFA
jgi:hypothetical protein